MLVIPLNSLVLTVVPKFEGDEYVCGIVNSDGQFMRFRKKLLTTFQGKVFIYFCYRR